MEPNQRVAGAIEFGRRPIEVDCQVRERRAVARRSRAQMLASFRAHRARREVVGTSEGVIDAMLDRLGEGSLASAIAGLWAGS